MAHLEAFIRNTRLCLDGQITRTNIHPTAAGGYADVFEGFFGRRKVAIKVVRPFGSTGRKLEREKLLRRLWREYLAWSRLSHPNILVCLGYSYDFSPGSYILPSLISPWMAHGNLTTYLEDHSGADRLNLLLGVANGLSYLHTQKPVIVHGDLRAGNILVSDQGIPCLTDFGLSRVVEEVRGMTTSSELAGSVRWMSPELFQGSGDISVYSDIWAYGMTALEVLSGERPYAALKSDLIVLGQIKDGHLPPRPQDPDILEVLDDHMWATCQCCWSAEPTARPSIEEVASMIMPLVRPGTASPPVSTTVMREPSPSLAAQFASPPDEGRISVAIDFGTTFSGVAYGSSRIADGKVQQILHWPGSFETFRKIPTCLLYENEGHLLAWGLEAKNASSIPGTIRCEWFKLFLEPRVLRDDSDVDPRLPQLPRGKHAVYVITDFLAALWEYAKAQITREIGAVADLDAADVWLTIPAVWNNKGRDIIRQAAITAGLVQASREGERNWRDRLHLITEPEAAAIHSQHLMSLYNIEPNNSFMICDAGGGTIDLAMYRVIGLQDFEMAEISAQSGANCGSLFLDLRFRDLVRILLEDYPVHLDPASLAYFMHAFSESDKLSYRGESDDDTMFHFTCFNVDDSNDPSVGLVNGELAIPGLLLRREVFDPVVNQVLELIEAQLTWFGQPSDMLAPVEEQATRLDALFLVGGFSGSEYLFKRVDERFRYRIKLIARPPDADTATSRGAAQSGLTRRSVVSSIVVPRVYIMKVELPAEPEDWQERPDYIKENNAGITMCQNRLQYIVAKGTVLQKGQRVKTKLRKDSATTQDQNYEIVLYTVESERIVRYTDECTELCKWTLNLGQLPWVQEQESVRHSDGFYMDFDLGLFVDGGEVRGVLIHEGQEYEDRVFDFLV